MRPASGRSRRHDLLEARSLVASGFALLSTVGRRFGNEPVQGVASSAPANSGPLEAVRSMNHTEADADGGKQRPTLDVLRVPSGISLRNKQATVARPSVARLAFHSTLSTPACSGYRSCHGAIFDN
jgi:hypothetical protein